MQRAKLKSIYFAIAAALAALAAYLAAGLPGYDAPTLNALDFGDTASALADRVSFNQAAETGASR